MTTIRLVKGRYPGATFDDLVTAVVEHNVMLQKSHRVLARKPNRISLICSVGRSECDFRAYATKLKKGKNGMNKFNDLSDGLGGVDGISINQFTHHTCTVGSQRVRQMKSAILENMVTEIQDFVPEKGLPGGATRSLQKKVKEASGIDLTIGQAHALVKKRRESIKNNTGRESPSQQQRVEQATNQLLMNFINEITQKDANGRYVVLDNTGKRKKAAKKAAELFFEQAGKDLSTSRADNKNINIGIVDSSNTNIPGPGGAVSNEQ